MNWPGELERMIRWVTGPEDEWNPEVNGDPDSTNGEEPDEGEFDEMSPLVGWEDESDDDDDEDGDDAEGC